MQKEIEDLRRESYVEQFKMLENRFVISLRKFGHWPDFVECGQRRNVFAHCNGVVSEQYIKVCKNERYHFPGELNVGEQLDLLPEYFFSTCDLMMEVGLKLGQTLWRKLFPNELKRADSHLINLSYHFLNRERWLMTQLIGEFGLGLPAHNSQADKMVMMINQAIALKFAEKEDELDKLIADIDETVLIYDFRLALAVLKDDFEKAAEMMGKIGKKGEYVSEYAYHSWPLFNSFRQAEQFLNAYEEIFGYSFSSKLQEVAEIVEAEIEEDIDKSTKAHKERDSNS